MCNLTGYISHVEPDMIVVHGDRVDAMAGAIVGALNNILVAHIEGGELSGTIDESIRHAISKMAHLHFVCNEDARNRLVQLGEEERRIYVLGSPDIDIMMSDTLPDMKMVRERYNISFDKYGVMMYHPVTTEYEAVYQNITAVLNALKRSGKNYVMIYPNNDLGSEVIISEYKKLEDDRKFRIFPSVRFEYFLTLLKNAEFMIGNSSAGVRETSVYGVSDIDIGTRQSGRYHLESSKNIQHVRENEEEILVAIERINDYRVIGSTFGKGNSAERFMEILRTDSLWDIGIQKYFVDM